MTKQSQENLTRLINRLSALGLTYAQIRALVRAQKVLHTWSEHECNGAIQRDEETGMCHWYSTVTGNRICRTSDRESGALRRIRAICEPLSLVWYHQGDPRGCALYVGTADMLSGADIDCAYNRLIAVCY